MTDRILIKGGIVLTQDAALGEMAGADVLVEDDRIAAVGRNLSADGARTSTRPATSSSRASSTPTGTPGRRRSGRARPDYALITYFGAILDKFAPNYRPEDVYAANQWGALECINAGITTLVDWSHIMNTPDHADAAIQGLQESGIRSVFAFGFPNTSLQDWWFGPDCAGSVLTIDGARCAPDPQAVLQLRRRASSRWRWRRAARTSASRTSSATTGSWPRSSGSTSRSTSRWTASATPRCSSRPPGHGPALPEHDVHPRLAPDR